MLQFNFPVVLPEVFINTLNCVIAKLQSCNFKTMMVFSYLVSYIKEIMWYLK